MKTLRERFEEKFIPEPMSGCWLWLAADDGRGYGLVWVDGGLGRANRISWELYRGPIPDDLHVLHRCDNPSCVNPDHLFLGTHQDNVADMWAKGRANVWPDHRKARGVQFNRTKLTDEDVRYIRSSKERGLGKRFGVSNQVICDIRHHRSWKHVP